MIRFISYLPTRIINFILPHMCLQCKQFTQSYGLCIDCFSKITFIANPMCQSCGTPFVNRSYGKLCARCLKNPQNYNLRSATIYNQHSKEIILCLKHTDSTHISKFIAKMMMQAGKEFQSSSDVIIPIPLHYFRLIKRKYNQSTLIANHISKEWNIPILHNTLTRIKNTESQDGKNFQQRKKNLKNAFNINNNINIKNKNILLIDDVSTTGTTIKYCSQILLKQGAKSVNAITYSRTNNKL